MSDAADPEVPRMTTRTSRRTLLGALLAGAAVSFSPAPPAPTGPTAGPDAPDAPAARDLKAGTLFLGTYTSTAGGGTGIGVAGYAPETGAITGRTTITGVDNPSYLALHPSGTTLYAVDEQEQGGVTAVALASDGTFRVLGTRSTGGAAPAISRSTRAAGGS